MSAIAQVETSIADVLSYATITPVSLTLRPGTTIEQAELLLSCLSQRQTGGKFLIGDLLLALEAFEGEGSQAIEASGLDYSTVNKYRWVARSIPVPFRDLSIAFSYYEKVASLSEEQIAICLTRLQAESLDWLQFCAMVAETKGQLPKEPKPPKAIGAAIDHCNSKVGEVFTQDDADLIREYLT
jgi:hypothetical protein